MANVGVGYRTVQDVMVEVSLRMVEDYVDTTLGAAVAAPGAQTVAIASTNFIYVGALLVVDTGANAEVIAITGVGSGTITADFAQAHANGVIVWGATFPAQQPTDPLFTQNEMLGYLARAQNEFLASVPAFYKLYDQTVSAGNIFQSLPADATQLDRVALSTLYVPILTLVRENDFVTVTTQSPHGLGVGSTPAILITKPGGTLTPTEDSFNGVFEISSVPNPTTFIYPQFAPDASIASFANGGGGSGTSYEMDQSGSLPLGSGSAFFGQFPTAISMLGVATAGDVFSEFTPTQSPDNKLFLTFYDSSFAVLQSIDASTLDFSSVVTAPAGTAKFTVGAPGATAGGQYILSFSINGQDGNIIDIEPDTGSGIEVSLASSFALINVYPLGAIVPGELVTVVGITQSETPGLFIMFYDSDLNTLSTTDLSSAPTFTAPAGAAFWSVQIIGASTPGGYDAVYDLSLTVPPGTVDAVAVYWIRLYEITMTELTMQNRNWRNDFSNAPTAFFEDRSGLYQWGVNANPSSNFPVELLVAARDTDTLGLLDGFLVPDICLHYVIYKMLEYIFTKEGVRIQPMVANYCKNRFDRGVETTNRFIDNMLAMKSGKR